MKEINLKPQSSDLGEAKKKSILEPEKNQART